MTQTKAATVVQAIVTAGYECRVVKMPDGSWQVRSTSPAIDVPVGIVAAFVTAQGITGFLSEVVYI
jgi:hypothetical protein